VRRAELVLLAAGVAVGLLLAEGALRLADRIHCFDDTSGGLVEPHPLFGWRHTPGAAAWAKRCNGPVTEWRTYVRINRHGLRDRELEYARDGAFRVLVLGDSFPQGLQVELEQTFPKQVERRLNEEGRRVEVVNTGVGGYTTTNELLFYRFEGRRYRPDLVLLAFNTENDAMENSMPLVQEVPAYYPDKPFFVFEEGRLVLRNFPLPEPRQPWRALDDVERSIARHSILYRFVHTLGLPRLSAIAHAADDPGPPLGLVGLLQKDYPPVWEDAWRVTRALIRRLRRDVERDGGRLAVVLVCGATEVSEARLSQVLDFVHRRRARDRFDMDRSYRTISAFLHRKRIPYIPLHETFRAHFRATRVDGYFGWDPHWTAVGHTLAADAIARGLVDRALVPAPGAGVR
jgi:hypothetical protein